VLYLTVSDQGFLDKFARANAISVSAPDLGTLRLPAEETAVAVQALRKCEDAKMREWGIDPAAWRALQSRPIPVSPIASWFKPSDYPPYAARHSIGSEIVAKIEVSPQGQVAGCTVLRRDYLPEFGKVVCSVLTEKGRFLPARNSAGQSVVAPLVVRLAFQAPNR
jgi:hypothetical protein